MDADDVDAGEYLGRLIESGCRHIETARLLFEHKKYRESLFFALVAYEEFYSLESWSKNGSKNRLHQAKLARLDDFIRPILLPHVRYRVGDQVIDAEDSAVVSTLTPKEKKQLEQAIRDATKILTPSNNRARLLYEDEGSFQAILPYKDPEFCKPLTMTVHAMCVKSREVIMDTLRDAEFTSPLLRYSRSADVDGLY